MEDFSGYPKALAEPEASSMIETLRAIGYNLETALADIIDNSITAKAQNVWVNFHWEGKDSYVVIKDDGKGMTNEAIIDAMRPGSRSPSEERDSYDLGRFGLGLKTASFSQSKRLTLISKTVNSTVSYWCWDLDYVVNYSKKWELVQHLAKPALVQELEVLSHGTIVLWEKVDKVFENLSLNVEKDYYRFLSYKEQVENHLALIFHRYLESGKIKIIINGSEIQPWSPYLKGQKKLQIFPEEKLLNGKVRVKGYVLPHHSQLDKESLKRGKGINGWNWNQGFYIYRRERLLVAATWFGLFTKEEHCKLARIQVDLSNDTDSEWQIDIKKSSARPPAVIKDSLKQYALTVRNAAVGVYRARGKKIIQNPNTPVFEFLWEEQKRHGKKFFRINEEHTLVKAALASTNDKKVVRALLQLIEETIPIAQIKINESEREGVHAAPFEFLDSSKVYEVLKVNYNILLDQGFKPKEAKVRLMQMPPLNDFPHLIDTLSDESSL